MITGPNLETREAMPYVAISVRVGISDIPQVLPPLIPEVLRWLQAKNISPAGNPFFRYLEMKGSTTLAAVGFPVAVPVIGDNRVQPGTFPAGDYAVVRYQGPYQQLFEVHTRLDQWQKDQNFELIGLHTEFYITDPAQEPDPGKWLTEIICQVNVN